MSIHPMTITTRISSQSFVTGYKDCIWFNFFKANFWWSLNLCIQQCSLTFMWLSFFKGDVLWDNYEFILGILVMMICVFHLLQPISKLNEWVYKIVKNVFKASPDIRNKMLTWLGNCMHSNTGEVTSNKERVKVVWASASRV